MMSEDRKAEWSITFFNVAVTIVLGVVGYYMHALAEDVKESKQAEISIRAEAAQFREQVARELVRKDEYRSDIGDIKRLLERIDSKVDRKADRQEPAARIGAWRDGREINR